MFGLIVRYVPHATSTMRPTGGVQLLGMGDQRMVHVRRPCRSGARPKGSHRVPRSSSQIFKSYPLHPAGTSSRSVMSRRTRQCRGGNSCFLHNATTTILTGPQGAIAFKSYKYQCSAQSVWYGLLSWCGVVDHTTTCFAGEQPP